MRFRNSLQRHPILAYFVLAFAISWCGSLVTLGPRFFHGQAFQITDTVLALVAMLLGPFLSGILMTAILDGKVGIRDLFERMGHWHVGVRWYAAALLIFPVALLFVLLLLSRLISSVFFPGFTALGILYGLMAGFFEETGWTGFAVPRMQLKFGPLMGAGLLGMLHGVWHIVADFLGSSTSLGSYWFPHFAAMWIVGLIALRILMVWVYNKTGSLLLAQLMHASFTGSLVALSPTPISPANETLWYVLFAVVLWMVTTIVLTQVGRRLSQPT
jgi:membrane protease YdiL (CAAX protease family)